MSKEESMNIGKKSTITISEVEALIMAAAELSERDATIISLMGKSGLKTGEVSRLHANQVDKTMPALILQERIVAIPPDIHSKLARSERGYIFRGRRAWNPITKRQVENIVKQHGTAALGRRITPNDLRRAFAIETAKTKTRNEVREIMGHKHYATTRRLLR